MKNRSDVNLSREKKASAYIYFASKKSRETVFQTPVYSYLPLDFSRQLFASIDSAESLKSSFFSFSSVRSDEYKSSFAYRMTSVILFVVEREGCQCDTDNCCVESFYSSCVARYCALYSDISDRELLVIFAKQIMIMLKQSGSVSVSNGRISANGAAVESLYAAMFSAFWNGVPWARLFPSMPQLAEILQEDRYILVELLSSHEGLFRVEDVARDYYSIMSVSCDDMLLYVSFLDYSFFSWMSHFGIIRYSGEEGNVSAEITAWGRNFLAILE